MAFRIILCHHVFPLVPGESVFLQPTRSPQAYLEERTAAYEQYVAELKTPRRHGRAGGAQGLGIYKSPLQDSALRALMQFTVYVINEEARHSHVSANVSEIILFGRRNSFVVFRK